ncbi:MAG TPA: glycosyltransferase family 2 protein [Methanosarcina sp.]|nr:glycosyltransferase family 2 protein [Methanosarcina sp.]
MVETLQSSNAPIISVVICTYNRADLLPGALDSLLQQSLEQSLFEIIVVDNNSTDTTPDVVAQYASYLHIRYIHEPLQGLAHARNRGYKEARGKYIAYLDDDARADPEWLKNILDSFNNTVPDPLVVGGPIYPFYLSKKPEWFKDEYEIRSWGDKPRFLVPKESFSGSNMIFTKKILERFGGFNTHIGVSGTTLSVGEETSLFLKIWEKSKEHDIFYYSPDVKISHYAPLEKMDTMYALKRSFASGQSAVKMLKSDPVSKKKKMKLICSAGIPVVYLTLKAIVKFPKYKHYQNWIFECGTPISEKIGTILELSGLHVSVKQYILNKSK